MLPSLCLLILPSLSIPLPFPSSMYDTQWEEDGLLVYTTHPLPSPSNPSTPFILVPGHPPIVHVYSWQLETLDSNPLSASSSVNLAPPIPPQFDLDLPISLRKGKHSYRYPISSFLSYDHLSSSCCCFVITLDSVSILKTVNETLSHPG